jgi:Glutathione S-transferase, C-terminal domain
MIEENLYWVMVNDRWNTPENWPILKATLLGGIPKLPREILAPIARRGVKKQLLGHGIGKHSAEEIAAIGARDIDALAALLGTKPWFFGDEPTETDAVVYSLLANIHSVGFYSPMKARISEHANLVSFI